MKNTNTKTKPEPDRTHYPVNYQWSSADGTICRGHTVAAGRSNKEAERRFFKQHRNVVEYAYD